MRRIRRSRDNLILHFSPQAPPICRLSPGEEVVVETVNALHLIKPIHTSEDLVLAGFDETLATPSTGPIAIEDASPGDTLVVEIVDIALASQAFTCLLNGVGLMAEEVRQVPMTRVYHVREGFVEFSDAIHVPIRPMVGIIGTTPLVRTRVFLPGAHGGNMDDPNVTVGARIYLPVYCPGALFAVGDVHAAQGDGETAMGVETDADVTLRVGLIKGRTIPSVQVEAPDRWIIEGDAQSMEEAIRVAARRMAAFLMERLDLTLEEATLLLCAAVNFRVNAALGGQGPQGFRYPMVMRAEIPKMVDRLGRL